MKAKAIRKNHEIVTQDSQMKYVLLSVFAVVMVILLVIITALLFKDIVT